MWKSTEAELYQTHLLFRCFDTRQLVINTVYKDNIVIDRNNSDNGNLEGNVMS